MTAIEKQVLEILKGIDKTEAEYDYGWWETSQGAEFGIGRRDALIKLIRQEIENRDAKYLRHLRMALGNETMVNAIHEKVIASITHNTGQCETCHHWENKTRWFGYCPVFNKETHATHGRQCTAYQEDYAE